MKQTVATSATIAMVTLTVQSCEAFAPTGAFGGAQVVSPKATFRRQAPSGSSQRSGHLLASLDPTVFADVAGPSSSVVQQLWEMYNNALRTNPLVTDAVTASAIYVTANSLAKVVTHKQADLPKLGRYAIFGCLDGFAGFHWYHHLDEFIPGCAHTDAIAKVVTDAAVFMPTYCALYLTIMTLLEGQGIKNAGARLCKEHKQLLLASWAMWVPANTIIYGVVPCDLRVLASCAVMFAYTIGLSLWDNGEHHSQSAAASVQHGLDNSDLVPFDPAMAADMMALGATAGKGAASITLGASPFDASRRN